LGIILRWARLLRVGNLIRVDSAETTIWLNQLTPTILWLIPGTRKNTLSHLSRKSEELMKVLVAMLILNKVPQRPLLSLSLTQRSKQLLLRTEWALSQKQVQWAVKTWLWWWAQAKEYSLLKPTEEVNFSLLRVHSVQQIMETQATTEALQISSKEREANLN
jgi:hypothetical protein